MDNKTLSDICDEINAAGPELDPVGVGAFAFTLIAAALKEDYNGFISKLVGGAPTPEQKSFREEVVGEIALLMSSVERALHDEAGALSDKAGDSPLREVPRFKIEDLPESGLSEVEHKLVPLVFEGAVRDTPAVKNWTPQRFKERYGSLVVPTNVYAGIKRPLGEFIDELIATKGKAGGFMTTNEDVFNAYPELVEELEIGKTAARLKMDRAQPNFSNHLFISGQMGFCPWHSAGDTNLFYMVWGEKDWYLAHPKHASWFYASMCSGHMRGHFTISPVNPKKSVQRRADEPLANRVPLYKVSLKPGDLLVVPPWWLHTVANTTEMAIAVAARLTTPALRNPDLGAVVLSTVERIFPGGGHMMDMANWRFIPGGGGATTTATTEGTDNPGAKHAY